MFDSKLLEHMGMQLTIRPLPFLTLPSVPTAVLPPRPS